jgi:hypothetical protein
MSWTTKNFERESKSTAAGQPFLKCTLSQTFWGAVTSSLVVSLHCEHVDFTSWLTSTTYSAPVRRVGGSARRSRCDSKTCSGQWGIKTSKDSMEQKSMQESVLASKFLSFSSYTFFYLVWVLSTTLKHHLVVEVNMICCFLLLLSLFKTSYVKMSFPSLSSNSDWLSPEERANARISKPFLLYIFDF